MQAVTDQGWTCRACANQYHDKCEEETNGVFCICQHTTYTRQVANRCKECAFVLTELRGERWCIDHSCSMFGVRLSEEDNAIIGDTNGGD